MRVHIRYDEGNFQHQHITLFINGKNCGKLCMGFEEAHIFSTILKNGCDPLFDEFVNSELPSVEKTHVPF